MYQFPNKEARGISVFFLYHFNVIRSPCFRDLLISSTMRPQIYHGATMPLETLIRLIESYQLMLFFS